MRVLRRTTSTSLMNGTSGMRTMRMPMMHGRMNSPTLKNTKVFPLRTKWRKHLPLGKSPAVS